MTDKTNAVEIAKLTVKYGKFTAVKDLSFSIPKGEVFGFIGPNGAGKSSTIKVLATLLKPTAGTACIHGIDVTRSPQKIRKRIGFVPDFFGMYDDLSVKEFLHFFAAAHRLDVRTRQAVVEDVLALTDLSDKIDAPVDGLSRGMKQRLSVARVLLHDPDVLLLDEPASGLDPRARIEIRELLKELQNMGKTILISSHILHEMSQLCTRIGIIEAGEMVAQGSLDEIYEQLSIRRIVHIQISNLSPDLVSNIRSIPGVSSAAQQADRLSLEIDEQAIAVEDLLDAVHTLGARIHMFQPEAMDMETAFMKLTKGVTA
jgi:ABC-2 type transport system ATP-binding protein